jgi:hypothetical protein
MKSLYSYIQDMNKKRLLNGLLLSTTAFIFAACNNQNEQSSPGMNISIAPSSYTWTVTEYLNAQGECVFFDDDYQDNVFVITLADKRGRPIGEMDLELYLSPSNSTSPPQMENQHAFYLYDDFNNNGVIDHPQELVSGTGAPILYATKTEKYHGTKTMLVRTNTSCGDLLATLHVYAGDGYASVEIETKSKDEPEHETVDDPQDDQTTE